MTIRTSPPKPGKQQEDAPTSKVEVTVHGRNYFVTCDKGQEKKLAEIVRFVNAKLADIAERNTGTNATEMRVFMLACLTLADELLETRKRAEALRVMDEDLMVAAVEHLSERINNIAQQIGKA